MDELVVFRKTYEYMMWLRPAIIRFMRVHRYGLGVEVQQAGFRLLRLVIQANYAPTTAVKSALIKEALVETEILRVLMRFCYEYKCFNERQFTYSNNLLAEIVRLLRGWGKKTSL